MVKKVFVGMSGGVDSSVAALLLKQQGYEVIGAYMKNWTQNLPGFRCPWEDDYQDAKRVAVQLNIPFKVYDFEKQYKNKVVDYMINDYKIGLTPNPDVRCNQEIKFKLFLDQALEDGADYIATGHYARLVNSELLAGIDKSKDQSYFLYRINRKAINRSLMPIGEYKKTDIRKIAKEHNLVTADKKDSQGICFIGSVDVKDFLKQFVETKPGKVIDQNGQVIGEHEGALFYTIGQRHGLNIGGGLPYYVVGKDMKTNKVFVTNKLDDNKLWHDHLTLGTINWINGPANKSAKLSIRTRYRAPLVELQNLKSVDSKTYKAILNQQVRAVTPGQSAVIYEEDRVVGGGIVV